MMQRLRQSSPGQSGVLLIAVLLILSIVVIEASTSTVGRYNVLNAISTKNSQQLYNIALSGIQEAMATRMVPRSNIHQLLFAAGEPTARPFRNTRSGYIYQNPQNPGSPTDPSAAPTNLKGIYRYFILGGDPAWDPTTNNMRAAISGNPSDLNRPENLPKQAFYVISQGEICEKQGTLGIDKIHFDITGSGPNSYDSSCDTGYTLKRLTLIATIDMSRSNPAYPTEDKVTAFAVAKTPLGAPILTNSDAITIPEKVYLYTRPDGSRAVNNSVSFYDMFQKHDISGDGGDGSGMGSTFRRLYFFSPFGGPETGGMTPVVYNRQGPAPSSPIPHNTFIRLYFDEPIDFRNFYDRTIRDNPTQCASGTCELKLFKIDSPTPLTPVPFLLYPNLPGSTQMTITGTNDTGFPPGTYQLSIPSFPGYYNGMSVTGSYTLTFTLI